jgi:hypothetical protein
MPPIKLKGQLADHFITGTNADGTVMCSCVHCDTSLAYHGSMTSLKYHLSRR